MSRKVDCIESFENMHGKALGVVVSDEDSRTPIVDTQTDFEWPKARGDGV